MKVQPVPQPQAPSQTQSNSAQDARARAIARLTEQPVQNANQVQPEELSAITASSGQDDTQLETQAEETPKSPSPAEDPKLASEYAKLAKQAKATRIKQHQAEQAFKQREAALAAREAELAAKSQEYSPDRYIARDRIKSEALQVLAESGITYEELTQQILNQQPIDPRLNAEVRALKAELQAIRDEAKKGSQAQIEAQQTQYNAAVKQIENEARQLVKADPAYEMVRATNSLKDVVELITETFNKDGVLLSVEEAAQQVEDYLTEEALKLTSTQKIKARLAANTSTSQQAAKPQTPAQTTKQPQPMKTLTNASASSRQLSAKERAILAFKGEKF